MTDRIIDVKTPDWEFNPKFWEGCGVCDYQINISDETVEKATTVFNEAYHNGAFSIEAVRAALEAVADDIIEACALRAQHAGGHIDYDDGRSQHVEKNTTFRIVDSLRRFKMQPC
jgi:hypothetical protein